MQSHCGKAALCRWLLGPAVALVLGSLSQASAEPLRAAIARAMTNSEARLAQIAAIDAQQHSVAISQGEYRPTVTLFGDVGPEYVDNPGSLSPADNATWKLSRQIGVTAEVTLLDGMRRHNQLYREATLLDAAIIRLSDETETLALNAVQAYLDVLRHRHILDLAHRNERTHRRLLNQVVQQVNAGRLPEADRFRANDRLLAARLATADAKAQLADAVSRYKLFYGVAPSDPMKLEGHIPTPRDAYSLEHAAVAGSYKLKLAETDITVLVHEGAIEAADWKPQVNAFATASAGADRGGSFGTETNLHAGLRLNWTLYQGGTKAQREARSKDLIARAHYLKKQLEDETRDTARRAWNAYQSAGERKIMIDMAVSTNTRIVSAYRQEFEAAKRSLIDVLTAEAALFNYRVQRVNADASLTYQRYKMLAAKNALAKHFGLTHRGQVLNAGYERPVVEATRDTGFSVSAPPLE